MEALKNVLHDAFATAFKKPLTYIGLVAIPLIVALFGLLYVNVFMDPYERMKDLPVAVVNLDEGATVNGEQKSYGSELVDSVMEDDSVLWTREGAELVDGGLENSGYYLAVVIPRDFSERVAAGQTSSPETAGITFFSNMRKNFMLSTLSSRVESGLRQTVNEKVGAQYAQALAEGLYDAKDGFSDAADGAAQLKDGSDALADGASQLDSGLDELASGASTLSDGLGELDQKLNGSKGTTLLEAASAVELGAETLKQGIGDAKNGAGAIAAGAQAAGSGLADAQTAAQDMEDGIAAAVAGWKSGAIPADAAMAAIEANMLPAATSHALSNGIGTARAALDDPSGASEQTSISAASLTLAEGLSQAEGKLGDPETPGTLLYGAHSVAEGVQSVGNAVASANAGSTALAGGAATALDGAGKLSEGTQELGEGATSLQSGLEDGRATIDGSLTATPEQYGNYIASPVEMENDVFGELDAFGYGFAPLFLTLCLWLGSLLLFFIFDPFPSKGMEHAGRFAAVLGRWPLYLILVALNVAAAVIGACASGVPNADSPQFILFAYCIGFSFFCILQMFSLFDIPGKALAIVILIVQVVCCSGTFPSVLGVQGASEVSPLLPFTYAIDGIRECISGSNPSLALSDAGTLLLFALVFVALSLALYPIALKLKQKRDEATIKALTSAGQPL